MHFTSKLDRPSVNMIKNGIDPNKNSVVQRFSDLDNTCQILIFNYYYKFDIDVE